jgi:hypothetical protein
MIRILTCDNCHRTSAATDKVEQIDFPRQGTWLNWYCMYCRQLREWLIPQGMSIEDASRQSRQNSTACNRSLSRVDVYKKVQDAKPEMQKWIFFGELVWWWREEAVIAQTQAAVASGLSDRHWRRMEAGDSKLRDSNIERVVRAVQGSMEQAYLLLKPGERWSLKFEQRLAKAEKQIKSPFFQKLHKDEELSPEVAHELDIALRELGRVLTVEAVEERFLFYAHLIHQTYWNRLLGGPMIVDDHKAELIPLIKKLISALKKTEKPANQYKIVNLIKLEVEYFMSKPLLLDLLTHFIFESFTSVLRREEVWGKLSKDFGPFSPQEKLILALFDLIKPIRQGHLLETCKQLRLNAKKAALKSKIDI